AHATFYLVRIRYPAQYLLARMLLAQPQQNSFLGYGLRQILRLQLVGNLFYTILLSNQMDYMAYCLLLPLSSLEYTFSILDSRHFQSHYISLFDGYRGLLR